jgi:transcriptional regulator GlxA family with amidase domain
MRSYKTLLASGIAALVLPACGSQVAVAPAKAGAAQAERQAQAFVQALKPRRPGRPLIVVLARNEGTETTDFLITHALLQRAGVADVQAVAPRRGRISLYPALEVEVMQDLASFDKAHPSGADYVIVPAMDDADDPAIAAWLRRQADRGARIVGVCAGALVVGRAGLLDGRRFTTHWYYRKTVVERHPAAVYVPHQRYVVDANIATTTGISASVPAMLAVVEAIGGRARAQALAAELGVDAWTPAHDSSRFGLGARERWNYVLTKAAFWRHEQWSVDVREGMDDVALAFAADAWSRTGRVSVEASGLPRVKLRSGLVLLAQRARHDARRVPLSSALKPVQQLDRALCQIAERFGPASRERVMIELEYADGSTCATL